MVLFSDDGHCGEEYLATHEPAPINSPRYPNEYLNNADCVTKLYANESHYIRLSFEAFNIEERSSCDYDYLEVKSSS